MGSVTKKDITLGGKVVGETLVEVKGSTGGGAVGDGPAVSVNPKAEGQSNGIIKHAVGDTVFVDGEERVIMAVRTKRDSSNSLSEILLVEGLDLPVDPVTLQTIPEEEDHVW